MFGVILGRLLGLSRPLAVGKRANMFYVIAKVISGVTIECESEEPNTNTIQVLLKTKTQHTQQREGTCLCRGFKALVFDTERHLPFFHRSIGAEERPPLKSQRISFPFLFGGPGVRALEGR